MISHDLHQQIVQRLSSITNCDDWQISGPEIEARDCLIYRAASARYPHDIAIKSYRKKLKSRSIPQYEALSELAKTLNTTSSSYRVPNVFGCFPKQSTFLMEWIEAPALEWLLWRYFYSKKKVQADIRKTFAWLSAFHKHADLKIRPVDISFYETMLQRYMSENDGDCLRDTNHVFRTGIDTLKTLSEKHQNVNTQHAFLHGDFTPTNILIGEDAVTGIDLFGNQHLPIVNDIALQFSYIAIEYPNMLTRSDFKLPPAEWPLLKIILEAYDYSKDNEQINFLLFVFLYQLLRRWVVIQHRDKQNKRMMLLDRWRLRNSQMIVENLCQTLNR